MATSTSASTHPLPEGVELGQGEGPRAPVPETGAGRIRTTFAPRSTTHSSSSMAFSTIGRVITGVVKIRCS